MDTGGLKTFGLTLDQAAKLPRGKRRSVAGYCVRFGHYQDARELLERIIVENPGGTQYRMWLVHALLGCGDTATADRLSNELVAESPESRPVILARAAALLTQGDARVGYEFLRRSMPEPRDSIAYWTHLGAGLQRRGWWTDARAALEQALAIHQVRVEQAGDADASAPLFLWLALARQEEHDGVADGPYRIELERARAREEHKVREALARPDPRSSPARPRARAAEWEGADTTDEPPELMPSEPTVAPCAVLPTNPELEGRLQSLFGFRGFRPGQQEVVESVLAGRSVLAVMPTGGGKSLCYQLPAMLLPGITLVISPLIALMKDQLDGLPSAVQQHATLINSSLDGDEIGRRLKELGAGKRRLVYAAPERLRQRPFLHALRGKGVSLLVVDEAHCVSMWGHDFRPDYLFIGDALAYLGHPTVLAMTATATPTMRVEIANHFGRELHVVNTGTHRPNLFLESIVVKTDEHKMRELVKLCREIDGPGIVYTRSRRKAEELAHLLRRERVQATHYHAGMDTDERARAQEGFMDGRWRVICATVAFGMGIDKPDVRFVVHYSLPGSLEDYYQEAGRAGRDGFPSRCILLSTPSDKALMTRWMRQERIGLDLPRDCYGMIRSMTGESRYAAVHPDDLERDLQRDQTSVRVAISLLENAGLVRRHLDIPTTATVALTPRGAADGDERLKAFASGARLRVNQRAPLDTLELCRRTGIGPDEIEERLLEWQSQGCVSYRGSGRVMLLERPTASRDARKALEALLQRHALAQETRVGEIALYAESRKCRHSIIARHFGERPREQCSFCDNCVPEKQPTVPERGLGTRNATRADSALTDKQKTRRILETVRMIPGQVGFTGLVRVLKGSIAGGIRRDRCPNFGVLAEEPKATIERRVSELLEQGYLVRDDSEYRLISVGPRAEESID